LVKADAPTPVPLDSAEHLVHARPLNEASQLASEVLLQ